MWYSAAWSAATLAAFRAAVTAKLALSTGGVNGNDGCSCPRCSTVSGHPEPSESQALLLHWQTADVPLAVARGKWLDVKDMAYTHSTWIGNFTRKVGGLFRVQGWQVKQVNEDFLGFQTRLQFLAVPLFSTRSCYLPVNFLLQFMSFCFDLDQFWSASYVCPTILAVRFPPCRPLCANSSLTSLKERGRQSL